MRQRRMNYGVRWKYDTKGDGFALFVTISDALGFALTPSIGGTLGPVEIVDLKTRETFEPKARG